MSWNGPSPLTLRVTPVSSTIPPRTGSAIEFCHHVIYIVCLVFCLASLRKLRRNCWSRAKRNYNSSRSEYRLHDGNLLQTSTFETLPVQMSALPPKADIGIGSRSA